MGQHDVGQILQADFIRLALFSSIWLTYSPNSMLLQIDPHKWVNMAWVKLYDYTIIFPLTLKSKHLRGD